MSQGNTNPLWVLLLVAALGGGLAGAATLIFNWFRSRRERKDSSADITNESLEKVQVAKDGLDEAGSNLRDAIMSDLSEHSVRRLVESYRRCADKYFNTGERLAGLIQIGRVDEEDVNNELGPLLVDMTRQIPQVYGIADDVSGDYGFVERTKLGTNDFEQILIVVENHLEPGEYRDLGLAIGRFRR